MLYEVKVEGKHYNYYHAEEDAHRVAICICCEQGVETSVDVVETVSTAYVVL